MWRARLSRPSIVSGLSPTVRPRSNDDGLDSPEPRSWNRAHHQGRSRTNPMPASPSVRSYRRGATVEQNPRPPSSGPPLQETVSFVGIYTVKKERSTCRSSALYPPFFQTSFHTGVVGHPLKTSSSIGLTAPALNTIFRSLMQGHLPRRTLLRFATHAIITRT